MSTLLTQLSAPSPPHGVVQRPRLLEQLRSVKDEPVTLVCGPAGAGKTALLSEGLGQVVPWPVAWVSLDRDDDEAGRLWGAVLTSMRLAGVVPDGSPLAALAPPVRESR